MKRCGSVNKITVFEVSEILAPHPDKVAFIIVNKSFTNTL